MARRKPVEAPDTPVSVAPDRVAGPCIVEQWVDVAAWAPQQWHLSSLSTIDDVETAVLMQARRLHRDARIEWRQAEERRTGEPYPAFPGGRPRWADVEAARPLLARWVGAYGATR